MTSAGRIDAPVVVTAAGVWSNLLMSPLGAPLPAASVRSHYWITERDSLFPARHPIAFLPDARAYTRPELGGARIRTAGTGRGQRRSARIAVGRFRFRFPG